MQTINKINKGLHIDFNVYDQPEGTMRDNRNGIIMDIDDGNFMWTNNEGTKVVYSGLNSADIFMKSCWVRNRLFFIVLNIAENYVVLYEAFFNEDGIFSNIINRWQGLNSVLNLSIIHPIRAMFGYYENDETQRIYWTDYNNPPRSVNLGNNASVTIDEKFIDFFPKMSPVYGNFELLDVLLGGSCKAGTYFFVWRLFNEGYYTDWSYITNPVQVTPDSVGTTFDDYQDFQGAAPNVNTSKLIKIKLTDLDDDYLSIQVAAFYSNDYNSVQPGMIFYDGDILGTSMILNFIGNENLGTVTISEILETTTIIDSCKDMTHVKKRNVLANIKERSELDVSSVHPQRKNNQMQVQIKPISHTILLDTTGYPDASPTPFVKALSGTKDGTQTISDHGLIPHLWYQALSETAFTDDDGAHVISTGDVFKVNSSSAVAITYGTVAFAIVKTKYRVGSSTDINSMENEVHAITNHYMNFKNPLVSNLLKSYPGGNTVRHAVVFFDKTGRPFYARHLYNTETSFGEYTIGPGDFNVPTREANHSNVEFPVHRNVELVSTALGYKYTLGNVLGVSISGIDVTDIRDRIGGFSIVRAPIERNIIAYGILNGLREISNDVTMKLGYRNENSDADHYEAGYEFLCPESLFDLTNFNIVENDKLVNLVYMKPIDPSNTEGLLQGYGKYESGVGMYQKFTIYEGETNIPTNTNGIIGAEHLVKTFTKYRLGDDTGAGISVDPSDATKLFKEGTDTSATNLGIVILDIDETGNNIKGEFNTPTNDPMMLICSLKRENNNPYGGLGDSALANTTYISTGHYQVVNDTVLNQIEAGGRYVFNNIDVYGGDSFICMFDFMRLLVNEDLSSTDQNHSIIVPMETRINLDLREGKHVAKDRSYWADNLLGIRRKVSEHAWGEFNYNDGYSSENIDDYYLALPYNFKLINDFDTRLRYSPMKTYGEREDSYRRFNALDYLDLASEYGAITNIRAKYNNLIYWQRDAIGYVPINERALSANSFGDPVQLGVGGIFQRHDEIINLLGNSNQFGLIESAAGFHWYDAVRKVFITLTSSMKLSQESIIRGLDSFFINDIPNNMDLYDNPIKDFGIIGAFDIRNKLVYLTYRMPGEIYETIGFNIKSGMFIGYFDFHARSYFNWKDWLYAVGDSNRIIYQHGTGIHGIYHGVSSPMYFTIIIKEKNADALIFDNFEFIGSENSFDTLKYENSKQSIEENINENRNIKFRNKRWYGNFPKVNRERLVDGYLKMTFYYNGSEKVSFNQIISTFRKMI